MSEIYLPHYISSAESIRTLTMSDVETNLISIKIKNFTIVETLVSDMVLAEIISSIEMHIKEFCLNNKISDYVIHRVQDYMFITSSKIIPDLAIKLRKTLYNVDFPVYISFRLLHVFGEIMQILPKSVQSLEYVDNISSIINDANIVDEYRLLSLLKKALNDKTVGFAYQPIVGSADGAIAYYECLMRIPDQNGRWISAGPAIMLAEKYDIIDMVDDAVIRMAQEELNASADAEISVNISNVGLLNDALLQKIIKIFKGNEIAKRLIIEVTETSENNNLAKTLYFIETVRALGIRVALDDFGVGATSFQQLCAIKFDIIKIDGSFIKDIETNPYHYFIAKTVVNFAQEVGAKTVAECVEDGKVAKVLMGLNVDFMQGNFFSPAQNFRSWNN